MMLSFVAAVLLISVLSTDAQNNIPNPPPPPPPPPSQRPHSFPASAQTGYSGPEWSTSNFGPAGYPGYRDNAYLGNSNSPYPPPKFVKILKKLGIRKRHWRHRQWHCGRPRSYSFDPSDNPGPPKDFSGPSHGYSGPPQGYPVAGTAQQPSPFPAQLSGSAVSPTSGTWRRQWHCGRPRSYYFDPSDNPGPPQGFSGPPQGFSGPSQGFSGPPQGYSGPTQGYSGPPQGYSGPPQGYFGPPQGVSGCPHGYSGPPQGFSGPPQGFSGPSQGYSGPPHGYFGPPQGYSVPPHGYSVPPQGYPFAGTAQQPLPFPAQPSGSAVSPTSGTQQSNYGNSPNPVMESYHGSVPFAQPLSTQILPAAHTQNKSVTAALPSPQYSAGPAPQPAPATSVSSGVKLPGNSTVPASGEPGSAASGTPGHSGEKTSASKGNQNQSI
ncbi:protein tfg-1-like isoform X2 [Crotalus tigris]|uniref:protein tfg-1-like isoform X2 n=1 Tax=Crotalus tigris TaxID=88082 RepID=UPI00192F1CC4|nr:protein tfg-1-like isoform X2 [Crotalus tigris]